MNEAILVDAFKAAPFLAFCVWMVYQMRTAIDRMLDRIEAATKVQATATEKQTEMTGRQIQSATQTEALLARALDLIADYTDELRRARGGHS